MSDANAAPVVVKVGGSEGVELDGVLADVAELHLAGRRVVLVHGGSAETNRVSAQLGVPPRFVTSPSGHESRYTDRATLEVFEMVYCGKINKGIVERLQAAGANAVGLSGLDGRLMEGTLKRTVRSVEGGKVILLRGDHTGRVERVNGALLRSLMDGGYLPVLTPPAISHEGVAMNVDGDRAAAAVAAELGAAALLLLSDIPGLLERFPDESSLIRTVDPQAPEAAMEAAQGRMKRKVLGALEAASNGVRTVVIGDSRGTAPVSRALGGEGTVFA